MYFSFTSVPRRGSPIEHDHPRSGAEAIFLEKLQERINRAEKQSEARQYPHCKKKRKFTIKKKKH
jgi:hypothetical protein